MRYDQRQIGVTQSISDPWDDVDLVRFGVPSHHLHLCHALLMPHKLAYTYKDGSWNDDFHGDLRTLFRNCAITCLCMVGVDSSNLI